MKRPRMSASDSDYSIDWLASDDDEDNDSELETECDQEQDTLPTTAAVRDRCVAQTCRKSSDALLKDHEDRSCRSSPPSSPTSSFSTGDREPSPSGQDVSGHSCSSGSPKGKSRQAQKRAWCLSVPEQKEKQLAASPTEKDKLFACKVRHVVFQVHSVQGKCQALHRSALITHMI